MQQISLTKQIAKKNARRESVKLAADLCTYFAETVIPQIGVATEEYNASQLLYLAVTSPPGQASFVLKDGEIVSHHFNEKQLPEGPKHKEAVKCVNVLEAFAIPFAAGVADEDIGYRETARGFCQGVRNFMPLIYQFRVTHAGRFESVIKLYEIWNGRLFAEMSGPTLKAIQEAVKKGESGQIKPIDD